MGASLQVPVTAAGRYFSSNIFLLLEMGVPEA
jgi:hypothetical protein